MLDLTAIKARLVGLPDGPWYPRITNDEKHMSSCFVSTEPGPKGPHMHHDHQNNLDYMSNFDKDNILAITLLQTPPLATNNAFDELTIFFAAARTDIPALIQEIERLNGVIRTYYDQLSERDEELATERANHQQWLRLHEENIKLRWEDIMEFQRWQAEKAEG